jgi:hypothetical protein
MTTYTIKINENNPKGKSLIDLLKAMNEVVTIVSEDKACEPESPYNKEFVDEILTEVFYTFHKKMLVITK